MTFNKMEDAVYYREKYGGKINVLIDEEKTWDEETESYEDDDETSNPFDSCKQLCKTNFWLMKIVKN